MTDLRTALREEAMQFAEKVHDLMVAHLTSMLGTAQSVPPASGVRPTLAVERTRRFLSPETVEEALAQIIDLLKKHQNGLRSEQIRAELGMEKKIFQYAANLGKTSDQLTQSGERRSTIYALPTRPSKAQEEGRVIKKKRRS